MSLSQTASSYLKEYSGMRKQLKLKWWTEVILILVFYGVYTLIRNLLGSSSGDAETAAETAIDNAKHLIDIENWLGLYREAQIQNWFLDYRWFLQFWNFFYGFFHFAVTIITFIWLYIRFPWDFAKWRTIGLITTGLGLIGFATFPVMPPRLLGDKGEFGGAELGGEVGSAINPKPGFVDTLQEFGGLWSFDSGAVAELSNQYAAMPSIHIAWASWCAIVIFLHVKSPYSKGLAVLYPLLTLFAITVTANHYWIDAFGGLLVLGVAILTTNFVYKKFSLSFNLSKDKSVC